ncbi:MAG TPA: universal stress protein [Candidatus Binatia bacterium]|jgi:nucleotide-binding universal stress UspA family protein|nr:universal stress protein [Candidatus Binatia bacterium]
MASKLFRRILVPHDFSDAAARALKEAVGLAAAHGGKIILQHVIVPFYMPAELPFGLATDTMPNPTTFIPELTKRLDGIGKKAVGTSGVKYAVRVEVGEPSQTIIEAAASADSIIMATHGRSGLAHLLIGSITEKIVRHSPIPVLTIRVPAKAGK